MPNRRPKERKVVLGRVKDLPANSSKLKNKLNSLRIQINGDMPSELSSLRMSDLISHFQAKELDGDVPEHRTYSTRQAYRSYLDNHILPRWDAVMLREVKAVHVEEWLRDLKPLANGTRAKIRNIMSALFTHAIRYGWMKENPIREVRQSAKRETVPDVLSAEEIKALLPRLEYRELVLVLLDYATGLRIGELLALKWHDIDSTAMQINVCRSIFHQRIGDCKTEASRKPVPLDSSIMLHLVQWREGSRYSAPDDWVFASPTMKGVQPYWPENLRRILQRKAKEAGITKHVSWKTFRHGLSCLLISQGENPKVVQELLRHANSRITLDVYSQALSAEKREAQSKVVRLVLEEDGFGSAEGLSSVPFRVPSENYRVV